MHAVFFAFTHDIVFAFVVIKADIVTILKVYPGAQLRSGHKAYEVNPVCYGKGIIGR